MGERFVKETRYTSMLILWLIAKFVFTALAVALCLRGDITLGEYLIVVTLLWFVDALERRGR